MPIRSIPSAATPPQPVSASPDAFYRTLFEEAYDGLLLYDEHGILLDCNQTILRFLGTTRAMLLASGLMAYATQASEEREDHWFSAPVLHEAILRTARTDQPFSKAWQGQRGKLPLNGWATIHRVTLPGGLIRVQLTLRETPPPVRQPEPSQALLLDQNRRQVQDLLSHANLSYVLLNREGIIEDVNDYFLDFTEY
ncbi:MAG TPA: PAS domain-containing protein, partial [Hymenobacter sp.]